LAKTRSRDRIGAPTAAIIRPRTRQQRPQRFVEELAETLINSCGSNATART